MAELIDSIGSQQLKDIITEFYIRAFADPIIGHIFWTFDRERLTQMQISFAKSMLGGSEGYRGKSLDEAHQNLNINNAHFGRRQVLMRQVLEDFNVVDSVKDEWLKREERLRPLIVRSSRTCLS